MEETSQQLAVNPRPPLIQRGIRPTAPQRLLLLHLPFVADRQFLATTRTSARQNFPAVLCRHPGAKAVGVLALAVVGLKGDAHRPALPTLFNVPRGLIYPTGPSVPKRSSSYKKYATDTRKHHQKRNNPLASTCRLLYNSYGLGHVCRVDNLLIILFPLRVPAGCQHHARHHRPPAVHNQDNFRYYLIIKALLSLADLLITY